MLGRSVTFFVCHDREPCKPSESMEIPFGTLSPGKHVLYARVHIGATWRIPLTELVLRRCGLMSDYFDHLFPIYYLNFLPFTLTLPKDLEQCFSFSTTVTSSSAIA